jgi:hypothetical protein
MQYTYETIVSSRVLDLRSWMADGDFLNVSKNNNMEGVDDQIELYYLAL